MKKKRTTIKSPIIKVNKSLNKYSGMNLFPEKLEKANETLQRIGLPKTNNKQKS